MPDDPTRPGEPQRDSNGDPLPSPRPLPNNPLPSDPLPSDALSGSLPPSFSGARQHGQRSSSLQGGPPPTWPPPPWSASGQAQGPSGQPQYYPVQVNGGQILTIGIVSFFFCGIVLGPIAYFQGNSALVAIDRGEADPFQRGNASAGRICGLISGILSAVILLGYFFHFIVTFVAPIIGGNRG